MIRGGQGSILFEPNFCHDDGVFVFEVRSSRLLKDTPLDVSSAQRRHTVYDLPSSKLVVLSRRSLQAHLHDLTENMNRRHRAAQLAGRSSVALHTEMFFAQNPTEEDAFVLSVDTFKIGVIVPRFGIEGSVRFRVREDENEYTSLGAS